MVNEQLQQINVTLKEVIDPHMGVNILDMGMVKRVEATVDNGIYVGLVLPCIGCPALELMMADIRKRVGALEGVEKVKVKVEWGHQWDRTHITEEARERAARHGYVI